METDSKIKKQASEKDVISFSLTRLKRKRRHRMSTERLKNAAKKT